MKIDPQFKKVLGFNEVSQIGIVVRDMDKALKNYSEIFGIEFPKVFIPEYFNRTYKGKPADFKYKVALGMMGDLQVELIEPMQGETAYREFLEKWGEGIHHLGFDVKNMDERIKTNIINYWLVMLVVTCEFVGLKTSPWPKLSAPSRIFPESAFLT